MKTYHAHRGGSTVTVHDSGEQYPLPPHLDLINYGATGYGWGHSRRGAQQLALALLVDALGDEPRAVALHLAYLEQHVATLNRDLGFIIAATTVRLDAKLIEDRAARAA